MVHCVFRTDSLQILYLGRPRQVLAWDDKLPPNGRSHGHVTIFNFRGSRHIFGTSEARYFKFGKLIDCDEY